jgi:hypothetical protein
MNWAPLELRGRVSALYIYGGLNVHAERNELVFETVRWERGEFEGAVEAPKASGDGFEALCSGYHAVVW